MQHFIASVASFTPAQMLQFAEHEPPHRTQGPISALNTHLQQAQYTIDRWPTHSDACYSETINLFPDHTTWFSEIKTRIKRKNWHPDQLRVITADMPSALRLAAWIRKAQLAQRIDEWRTGEYVRSIDPHFQLGEQVAPAHAEYRIASARSMVLSHSAGTACWTTPGGKTRSLDISIQGVEVQALKLMPLTGGVALTVMAELPQRDHWRNECKSLTEKLRTASHHPVHAEAIAEVKSLQQMVMRLRPAAVITPELINGRIFQAAALHPDLSNQACEGILMTQLAVAAAERELLLVKQEPRW